jgi:hypothetical protein
MTCEYEMATTSSRPPMAAAIGQEKARPAAPATTRPRKISWLAYATEESASGDSAARARVLFSRSDSRRAVGSGAPKSRSARLRRIRGSAEAA